jgi:hypothetical protein
MICFCLKWFHLKYLTDSLILDLKQFRIWIRIRREIRLLRFFHAMGNCGEFFYALWATTVNLVGRYGPLRQICYTLQTTAADLVVCYGPLRRIKPYSKNLYWFLCYGPWCRIWLCAMGYSAGFGYLLWAIAKDLVKGIVQRTVTWLFHNIIQIFVIYLLIGLLLFAWILSYTVSFYEQGFLHIQ